MGTPDPKLFPAPGAVPNSGAVNPLNPVQKAPVISQSMATPSLAAMTRQTPVATPTTQPVAKPVVTEAKLKEWLIRKFGGKMDGFSWY